MPSRAEDRWTDADIKTVRDNWGKKTSAEIGRSLQRPRTGNAVTGKADRLGLPRLETASQRSKRVKSPNDRREPPPPPPVQPRHRPTTSWEIWTHWEPGDPSRWEFRTHAEPSFAACSRAAIACSEADSKA